MEVSFCGQNGIKWPLMADEPVGQLIGIQCITKRTCVQVAREVAQTGTDFEFGGGQKPPSSATRTGMLKKFIRFDGASGVQAIPILLLQNHVNWLLLRVTRSRRRSCLLRRWRSLVTNRDLDTFKTSSALEVGYELIDMKQGILKRHIETRHDTRFQQPMVNQIYIGPRFRCGVVRGT